MFHVEATQVGDVRELEVLSETQVFSRLEKPWMLAETRREVSQASTFIFFQQGFDELFGLLGQLVLLWVVHFKFLYEQLGLFLLITFERRGAEQHLVQHDAQTPVIVRWANGFACE